MDVRNCKMCGHLFNYTNSPLCPQCNKKLEERFQDVKEYIRENPGGRHGNGSRRYRSTGTAVEKMGS